MNDPILTPCPVFRDHHIFLKDSNHKMAITILANFYKEVINGTQNSIPNFIDAIKAIAAFYAIWRAARPNAGLDNVYREFFKGAEHSWRQRKTVTVQELKEHLKAALHSNNAIEEFGSWEPKALIELKYNRATSVCRFALFMTAHDTIPDPQTPGLMKIGVNQSSPYLSLEKWNSADLKHIEHIAPRKNEGGWDEALYALDSELFQSIGNLTLLPSEINISASNKGWHTKHLYYSHLSEKDPAKVAELANNATNAGIRLSGETVQLLQSANNSNHIAPIVGLGEQGAWNAAFVESRALRIIEIFWIKVSDWLFA